MSSEVILILGGSGKTGRRVAERLLAKGRDVRLASRSTVPAFDWTDPSGWGAALDGVDAAYVSYQPDLAVPGAVEAIGTLSRLALKKGVRHLVLLSGRGEDEALAAEEAAEAIRYRLHDHPCQLVLPEFQRGLPAGRHSGR